MGCPMNKDTPLTDAQIRKFCNLGCSVICEEEYIKYINKLKRLGKLKNKKQGVENAG